MKLNRPLLVAQLPSLLSKVVGGTEQNLASLFRDARAEGAALLLLGGCWRRRRWRNWQR